MPTHAMKALFRSKEEIYNLFLEEGGYYLPPRSKTPIQFLKDVLVGKKELLLRTDVNRLEDKIPRFSELIVKNLWEIVKTRPDLLVRFPDYQGHAFFFQQSFSFLIILIL